MDHLAFKVDQRRITHHVEELVGSPRHSLHNPGAHSQAIDYIEASLKDAGLDVTRHEFPGGGRVGVNIIGRKDGSDQSLPPLLATAHYDTVPGSPGADDNATGIAALLETAQHLGKASAVRDLVLVAFDMEEIQPDGDSLVGSAAYVKALDSNRGCMGVYNLEMLGYTSGPNTQTYPAGFGIMFPRAFGQVQARDFRGDFIAAVSRGPGSTLARRLEEAAAMWDFGNLVLVIETPSLLPLMPDIFRSDHASFCQAESRQSC